MHTPNNILLALIQSCTLHHFCCIYNHTECIAFNQALRFLLMKYMIKFFDYSHLQLIKGIS